MDMSTPIEDPTLEADHAGESVRDRDAAPEKQQNDENKSNLTPNPLDNGKSTMPGMALPAVNVPADAGEIVPPLTQVEILHGEKKEWREAIVMAHDSDSQLYNVLFVMGSKLGTVGLPSASVESSDAVVWRKVPDSPKFVYKTKNKHTEALRELSDAKQKADNEHQQQVIEEVMNSDQVLQKMLHLNLSVGTLDSEDTFERVKGIRFISQLNSSYKL